MPKRRRVSHRSSSSSAASQGPYRRVTPSARAASVETSYPPDKIDLRIELPPDSGIVGRPSVRKIETRVVEIN